MKIGDGSKIKIEGVGDVRLDCVSRLDGSRITSILLKDCLYVPDLGDVSLVSVRKCQKNGLFVLGYGNKLEVRQSAEGRPVCLGVDVGRGLFELQLDPSLRRQWGLCHGA